MVLDSLAAIRSGLEELIAVNLPQLQLGYINGHVRRIDAKTDNYVFTARDCESLRCIAHIDQTLHYVFVPYLFCQRSEGLLNGRKNRIRRLVLAVERIQNALERLGQFCRSHFLRNSCQLI